MNKPKPRSKYTYYKSEVYLYRKCGDQIEVWDYYDGWVVIYPVIASMYMDMSHLKEVTKEEVFLELL